MATPATRDDLFSWGRSCLPSELNVPVALARSLALRISLSSRSSLAEFSIGPAPGRLMTRLASAPRNMLRNRSWRSCGSPRRAPLLAYSARLLALSS